MTPQTKKKLIYEFKRAWHILNNKNVYKKGVLHQILYHDI